MYLFLSEHSSCVNDTPCPMLAHQLSNDPRTGEYGEGEVPPWQVLVGLEGGRVSLIVFSSCSSERQYCCLQKAVCYAFAPHILCDVVWVTLM